MEALIARFEARRAGLLEATRARRASLPLRLLRQTSHFTTPASDPERVKKAAAGLGSASRLLERAGVAPADVAAAIEVPPAVVDDLLRRSPTPPFVLVDAEDATAPDPAVQAKARTIAADALATLPWGDTLAFYRPGGLETDACVRDLVEVLSGVGARGKLGAVDGVVWPKATHEDEVKLVDELLLALEQAHGAAPRSLRLGLLIESAAALLRLERIVDVARPRLASLIIGTADLSSDLALPSFRNGHPSLDDARRRIVLAAAAAGVPAIDGMTLEYPVADKRLDAAGNRARILGALAACARDARHGADLGMAGKWVGHPLQLLVNEAVRRASVDASKVEADLAAARAYAAAVAKGEGAVMIGALMVDRAYDRHVRVRLRQALALGAVEPAALAGLSLEEGP
jgi:citrate lyase beta subunit